MSRREDLAWVAGVFDGEGCISLSRRAPQKGSRSLNPSYRLILKVAMCHESTIKKLRGICDGVGSIHVQRLQHIYFSPSWIWFCNAGDAEHVIKMIQPWLTTKAKEADVALQFCEHVKQVYEFRGGRGGSKPMPAAIIKKRERFYIKLRNLKSRNRAKDKLATLERR